MKITYQKLMTKVEDGSIRIQAWFSRAGVTKVQATVFIKNGSAAPVMRTIEVTNVPEGV